MEEDSIYQKFKWSFDIRSYGYLAILIFGTLTHITSLIVLRSKSFKTSPVSGSFTVFSLVQLAALYSYLLPIIIGFFLEIDILVAVWCKINIFLRYFFVHLACWTFALIVIERTLIVCFPLHTKPYITTKNAAKVWLSTAFILVCVNCHFFFTLEYRPITEEKGANFTFLNNSTVWRCQKLKRYELFWRFGFCWIDIFISTIIPFLLIFSSNIIILVKIKKSLVFKMSNNASNENTSAPNSAGDHNIGNPTYSTKMVLCMSVVFLILTLPTGIVVIKVNEKNRLFSVNEAGNYFLADSVTLFFFYFGFCINGVVFYLTGSKFRKSFKECFCICKSLKYPISNTPTP